MIDPRPESPDAGSAATYADILAHPLVYIAVDGRERDEGIQVTLKPGHAFEAANSGTFATPDIVIAELARATPPARAAAAGDEASAEPGIYMASKAVHGPRWRDLRAAGWPIISTWIDEAEAGRTTDWADLWDRCAGEPARAAVTVLYAEGGEELKGALAEVGAALSHGRKVIVVGPVSHTWTKHRNVEVAATLPIALIRARFHIKHERPASGSAPSAGTVTLEEMAEALYETQPPSLRPAVSWSALVKLSSNGDTGRASAARMLAARHRTRAVAILTRLSDASAAPQGHPIRIGYVNWRGEATTPTIVPTRLFWGSNEWHPEPCWLLEALDVEKQALRTFDLRRIHTFDAALPSSRSEVSPDKVRGVRANDIEAAAMALWRLEHPEDDEFSAIAPNDWNRWPETPKEASLAYETHSREEYRRQAQAVLSSVGRTVSAQDRDAYDDGYRQGKQIGASQERHRQSLQALPSLNAGEEYSRYAKNPKAMDAEFAALASMEADDGWRPIETAPYCQEVEVQVGMMRFLAELVRDGSINADGKPCDQWWATREGEYPPSWSDGACWENNEDLSPSLQPMSWRPVPAPPAPASAVGEG